MTAAGKLETAVMRDAIEEAVRLLEAKAPAGSLGKRRARAMCELLLIVDEMLQPDREPEPEAMPALDLDTIERRAKDEACSDAQLGDDTLALVAEVRRLRAELGRRPMDA